MKSIITFYLLATVFLTSCDVSNSDSSSSTYSYVLQKDAMITTDSTEHPIGDSTGTVLNFSVESGDKNVFTYKHNQRPPKGVMDGGFSEELVFQVPADVEQFELSNSIFSNGNALYRRSCFCSYAGTAFEVSAGTISGEKLSSVHWIIHGDVTIETPYGIFELSFKEPFHVQ